MRGREREREYERGREREREHEREGELGGALKVKSGEKHSCLAGTLNICLVPLPSVKQSCVVSIDTSCPHTPCLNLEVKVVPNMSSVVLLWSIRKARLLLLLMHCN